MRNRLLRGVSLLTIPTVVVLCLGPRDVRAAAGNTYAETDLVSDLPGRALHQDPNLVNPWGISLSDTSPFWVSDNGKGVSTLYDGEGEPNPLVVTIPTPAGGTPPSKPTGTVFNGGSSFEVAPGMPSRFLLATEDGTISGWNFAANPAQAIRTVDNSPSGAIYKGLAIGNNGAGDFLYAANFSAGTIDVFNSLFGPATLPGSFTDPNLPAGYAPFNIQNLEGKLYVTYALQDANKEDDVPGAGNGFVNVFDLNGNLLQRLVSQGPLNSPWGLVIAPDEFGLFSEELLVGNFGDGTINAFDPSTGNFLGALEDTSGNPIRIEGLWALTFGNDAGGGEEDDLYFTAGIGGEEHGLFGEIALVPESGKPMPLLLGGIVTGLCVRRHRKHRASDQRSSSLSQT